MYYLTKRDYDYAIRICAYLAGSCGKSHFSIQQLSSKLLITKPFATKIVYQLKKNNILKTIRGKNGGVLLAIKPEELSLFQICEAMGLAMSVSDCINVDGFCPLPAPCNLHSFFIEQENQIIEKLKIKTINEFAFTDADLK
ncbi:MAG: Rrf2 family transcriptional regulator [Bacteroidetes bacterium]|nr:Rrf2 family transcriptional regulator [Bacteroidota bacterium]MBU1115706.1 Rrf2 family transcriptional regulator [Bacteroidota bacterium]MBU1799937.1 Rrf2 family transcriptional regulator [Bacteroidota bacterium]